MEQTRPRFFLPRKGRGANQMRGHRVGKIMTVPGMPQKRATENMVKTRCKHCANMGKTLCKHGENIGKTRPKHCANAGCRGAVSGGIKGCERLSGPIELRQVTVCGDL